MDFNINPIVRLASEGAPMNKYLALFLIIFCLFVAGLVTTVGSTGKINNPGCPSWLQHYTNVECE